MATLRNRFLSRVFHKLYRLTKPEVDLRTLATENDYYIVSYPRSGNTWLRAMVAELLYGQSGKSIKDIQHYVPDIHVATPRNWMIASPFRVFKSHERPLDIRNFTPNRKKVIYLIRDPRDVVISYCRYWKCLRNYQKEFDDFFLIGFTAEFGPVPGRSMSIAGPMITGKSILSICTLFVMKIC